MKKYRYITTDGFKVGDYVWVTGIKFSPSGRIKYRQTPIKCKIKKVSQESIEVDNSSLGYYIPNVYYLDNPDDRSWAYRGNEYSINSNIANTKEEANENFNQRIIEEIEEKYDSFKSFESRAKYHFL